MDLLLIEQLNDQLMLLFESNPNVLDSKWSWILDIDVSSQKKFPHRSKVFFHSIHLDVVNRLVLQLHPIVVVIEWVNILSILDRCPPEHDSSSFFIWKCFDSVEWFLWQRSTREAKWTAFASVIDGRTTSSFIFTFLKSQASKLWCVNVKQSLQRLVL